MYLKNIIQPTVSQYTMPKTTTDESTVPMLGKNSLDDLYDHDIEELAANMKDSPARNLHGRQDSYTSSWSFDTVTPSIKSRPLLHFLTWLRWGVLVGLQIIIIFLLWQRKGTEGETDIPLRGKVVETGGDINNIFKTSE